MKPSSQAELQATAAPRNATIKPEQVGFRLKRYGPSSTRAVGALAGAGVGVPPAHGPASPHPRSCSGDRQQAAREDWLRPRREEPNRLKNRERSRGCQQDRMNEVWGLEPWSGSGAFHRGTRARSCRCDWCTRSFLASISRAVPTRASFDAPASQRTAAGLPNQDRCGQEEQHDDRSAHQPPPADSPLAVDRIQDARPRYGIREIS